MKLSYCLLCILSFFLVMRLSSGSLEKFEPTYQDFVLETKRIEVPGYPLVFNPSIVKWKKSFLMSFRVNDEKLFSAKAIGIIVLDENFNVQSKPYILKMPRVKNNAFFVHKKSKIREQDPRLITINDRIYMVYNNFQVGRMVVAELHFDGANFGLDNPICLMHFEGASSDRIEKNWVPFEYDKKLLLTYSISPHKIFSIGSEIDGCTTYACTQSNIQWPWGEIRGGTPALLVDGKYLSFFHSSKWYRDGDSKKRFYFIGAYRFDAQPPFAITHVSSQPIMGKDFYKGKEYKLWDDLRVVFPMGFVCDGDYIWLSYGKQDNECWIVKIDKNKLIKSLLPI